MRIMCLAGMLAIATIFVHLCVLSTRFPVHTETGARRHTHLHAVPSTRRVIFFVHIGDARLSAICCCGVLAAARHNPDAVIVVYMENITVSVTDQRRCWGDQGNVQAIAFTLQHLFSGTPLSVWYAKMTAGDFPPGNSMQNIANAARLAFVYKKGGMYLDLDIITMADYASLPVNVVGAQGWDYSSTQHSTCNLNNAAMSFEPRHPFLLAYMQEFVAMFRNDVWGWNGPERISDTCRRYRCNNVSIAIWPPTGGWWMPWRQTDNEVCAGLQPVHDETFAPIHHSNVRQELGTLLTTDEWRRTVARWKQTPGVFASTRVYAVHVFNPARRLVEEPDTRPQHTDTRAMMLEHLLAQECGAQWRERH